MQGSNLYIVLEDDLVFVPLNELKGKSKEALKETVKQHIVGHLTANLKEFYTEGGQLDQEGFRVALRTPPVRRRTRSQRKPRVSLNMMLRLPPRSSRHRSILPRRPMGVTRRSGAGTGGGR